MPPAETIYVVDDDPATRALMVAVVKHLPYEHKGFASVEAFLASLPQEPTGCVLLDVRMPGMSGLDLQLELRARKDSLPVIFVTGFGDVQMAVQSIRLGAVDFIEKPFRAQHLLDCVYRAMAKARQLRDARDRQRELKKRFELLTGREEDVVELVAEGLANKAIAMKLSVSPQAIDARRTNAMRKLGVGSIAKLIQMKLQFEIGKRNSRENPLAEA